MSQIHNTSLYITKNLSTLFSFIILGTLKQLLQVIML